MRSRVFIAVSYLAVMAAQPSLADTVISTDLIVVGNTCVGSDCGYSENFGSDEFKLKENNTRVVFGLPNQTGSFRMVANNSRNGSENRFSIDVVHNETVAFSAPQ